MDTSWRTSWSRGRKTCRKQVQLLGQLLDQLEYQLRANKRVCRESRQQVRTPAESTGTTGVTRSKGAARAPSEEGRTGLPKQRGKNPAGCRYSCGTAVRASWRTSRRQHGAAEESSRQLRGSWQTRKPAECRDSWQRQLARQVKPCRVQQQLGEELQGKERANRAAGFRGSPASRPGGFSKDAEPTGNLVGHEGKCRPEIEAGRPQAEEKQGSKKLQSGQSGWSTS
jgi:hypothetical protein